MQKNILSNSLFGCNCYILALYWLFFLILFFQFPINGSLPGHWDTWLHLSLYNYYVDCFKSLLEGRQIYYAMWPSDLPYFRYGEMSLLSAFWYWPCKWIFKNDLWAYYVHISFIYALTSFSMYKLCSLFFRKSYLPLLGGLLLTTTNYYLASIDQVNVVSVYPAIFCIFFILKWCLTGVRRYLFIAAICYGMQIYASGYLFFYLNLCIGILFVFYRTQFSGCKNIRLVLFAALTGFALVLPYIYTYIFNSQEAFCINGGRDINVVAFVSIKWSSFSNSLPYNILYGDRLDRTLIDNVLSINIGIILPVLGIWGMFLVPSARERNTLGIILLSGFILGIGPVINFANQSFLSPLYEWIISPLGIDKFLRTPVRAYTFILIIVILTALYAIDKIKRYKYFSFFFILGIFLENIPYKFQYFESKKYLQVPEEVLQTAQKTKQEEVLLILPSTRFTERKLNPQMDENTREYIYMYWQTKFKKDMLNGGNGFIPYKSIFIHKEITDRHYSDKSAEIMYEAKNLDLPVKINVVIVDIMSNINQSAADGSN